MEKQKITMEGVEQSVEDARILFAELRCMKLGVSNGFRLFFGVRGSSLSIEGVRVSEDNVQPDVRLHFFHYMGKVYSGNTLYGLLICSKWLEKAYYALRYSCLLAFLMNVSTLWMKEHYFGISIFLFFWFGRLRFELRVHNEERTDLDLT